MSAFGLILTVVAAAGWSGLDIARKVAVGRMKPETVLVWLVAGQVVLFGAYAGYTGLEIGSVGPYAGLALLSIALNVVANLAYLHAVRLSPFSLMIPLLSFVPVFTVAFANPLLGEMPSGRQLVGIAAVVAGTLAMGFGADEETGHRPLAVLGSMVRGLLRERGTIFMLVTSLCWAATMVVDKMAMTHASAGTHGVVLNAGIGVAMLAWLGTRGRLAELRQARGSELVLVGAVLAGTVGLAAQLLAVQYLLAGVVEAIKRAVGLVVAVVVGRVAFSEPVTRAKLVAVALMSVGTALIVV